MSEESPPEPGERGGDDQDERGRLMRAGMRGRLRRWARATGTGARRATPVMLTVILAAGAFAELIGSGVAYETLSSIGGNILTDIAKAGIDRTRPGASREEIGDAIQERIVAALGEGGERAAAVRADIARLLSDVGGIGELLREVLSEQEELRWQVIEGFASLGEEFEDFRFLLHEILEVLRGGDDRHTARQEQILDRMHRLEIQGYQVQLAVEAGERPPPSEQAPSPFPPWRGECPYRGLAAFQQSDAALFHGRAQATEDLLGIVARTLRSDLGMVMVTGTSGTGKSSLLRAGLLPALAAGMRAESSAARLPVEVARWPRIVITPKQYGSPLRGLAVELAALAEKPNQRELLDQLTHEPERAGFLVQEALLAEARRSRRVGDDLRLVLVVDQFEQLFGMDGEDLEETPAFVTALRAAAEPLAGAGAPPALVVAAMRGDQVDRCARYSVLRQVLQDNQFVLGPMAESDLRRAIRGQATAGGLRVEDGLVEMILEELRSPELAAFGTGTLPLVAQAMLLTWEKREKGWLTCRAYDRSGGVRKAVERSAEEVYGELGPQERAAVIEALRRMMFVGSDGRVVIRRVALEELPVAARPVLHRFATRRLLVIEDGAVEPAHQVLVKAWPRLRDWLGADTGEWKLYWRLDDDAAQWRQSERSARPSFLYTGRHLETVRSATARWLEDPGRFPTPTVQQTEFLDAAIAAERVRRRQRAVALASIAILVVAVAVAVLDSGRSKAGHMGELSRRLAASSAEEADPVTAALLAAAAWRVAPTDEARHGLRAVAAGRHRGTLTAHLGGVRAVTLSRDGRMMATSGRDSLVRLWDVATRRPIGRPIAGHTGDVTSLAFGADGQTLVSAGEDRTVQVWDLQARERTGVMTIGDPGPIVLGPGGAKFFTGTRLWDLGLRRPLGDPLEDPVGGVAFSPDGRMLAMAGQDANVRLWDTAINRQVGSAFPGAERPLAFSPDGAFLLTAAGGERTRLWDVARRRTLGERPGCAAGRSARVAAFRPDDVIAVGCDDGSLRLWSMSGRGLLGGPLHGHAGAVTAISFSPDRTTLVSASGDDVRLWDVRDPLLRSLDDRNDPIAVDGSGRYLATGAGHDGNRGVLVWDLATGRSIGFGGQSHWSGLAFSPGGRDLAAGGDDRIQIWDAASGATRGVLGDTGPVHSLGYSADGRSLVAASGEAGFTVRWWDARSGRLRRTLTPKVTAGEDLPSLGHLTLSPDLRLLASVQNGQSVRLWDLADGRPLSEPLGGHPGVIEDLAFSQDARLVATAGSDHTLRLWDTATRRPTGEPLTGHTGDVLTVGFSDDGRTLASGGRDGTVRLWDTATGRRLGEPLTGAFETVNDLAFLPGRGTLASTGDNGTLDLWRVGEAPDLLAVVCAVAGREMTPQEWRRYAPEEDFRPVCDDRAAPVAAFPSARSLPEPLPVISPEPSAPEVVPATAAQLAGRYTMVLDADETKAAFRRDAPAQTHRLQQDITDTAAGLQGERPVELAAACAGPDCGLRLTGFANGPAITLARLRDGTFRASAGHRTWRLRATAMAGTRVTVFTLTYLITDPTGTYSGSLGFRAARP